MKNWDEDIYYFLSRTGRAEFGVGKWEEDRLRLEDPSIWKTQDVGRVIIWRVRRKKQLQQQLEVVESPSIFIMDPMPSRPNIRKGP